MDYRVISADNHIIEPPNTFVDRVPAHLRDKAPRVVRGEDGGDGWSLDGTIPKSTIAIASGGLGSVNPGVRIRDGGLGRGLRWDEIVPGNYDGAAHVKDMLSDGIDASVVYPQVGHSAYYNLPDRELAFACLRAFNDWVLDEFQAADPQRLVGLALVPTEEPMAEVLKEVDRVLKKGARGFFLSYTLNRPHHDPYWDPLWKLIADAGAVASLHLRFGARRAPAPPPPDGIKPQWMQLSGIVQGYFCALQPLTDLIMTGMFERVPHLKFVHAEVNLGWVPFWAQMMDTVAEEHAYWSQSPLPKRPSEYVGKNVFVTFLDDPEGFRQAQINPLARRAGMFSIDYPHEITLFSKTQQVIEDMTVGLDEAVKHDVLAGNAARLFNLV
jgi:predicted TIM-barrel fold metal-dependent hydrolase